MNFGQLSRAEVERKIEQVTYFQTTNKEVHSSKEKAINSELRAHARHELLNNDQIKKIHHELKEMLFNKSVNEDCPLPSKDASIDYIKEYFSMIVDDLIIELMVMGARSDGQIAGIEKPELFDEIYDCYK